MTCEDLEARIAEFLAGELEDRSGVEEHLVACAECRGQFSTARSGWQAADEWSVSGPSGDAIAATLTALEPVAPSKPLLRFLQAGTMAASLVIAFVIGTSNREKPAGEKPAPVAANPMRSPRHNNASTDQRALGVRSRRHVRLMNPPSEPVGDGGIDEVHLVLGP